MPFTHCRPVCFTDIPPSIIGNGVALNIPVLFNELKEITSKGVPEPKILVSDRAQIVMPYHILFDQYEEERLGGKSFGSTKSGIAPFYSDKYAKIGSRSMNCLWKNPLSVRRLTGCSVRRTSFLSICTINR